MSEAKPTGQRVIVTGATGGIGRAIVGALGLSDCVVAACDVPGAPLTDVPGAAVMAEFDVRDRADVAEGVRRGAQAPGGCDAVIANAGIVDTIHRAERFPDEDWRRDLETRSRPRSHCGASVRPRSSLG